MKNILYIVLICSFFSISIAQSNRGVRVIDDLSAQKRVALIIGNSAYQDMPLRNPVNDARDFAGTLNSLGFDVVVKYDLTRSQMREAIRDFGRRLRDASGVGLFFFAGHGIQVEGLNYLIPIGADIEQEWEVKDECLEASVVLRQMEAVNNPMNIMILDACRNNPLARSWRSSTRGLARMEAPRGTVILYSTEPGSVANDGFGKNSPFTHHLVELIAVPGLDFMDVIRDLNTKLLAETNGKQAPWMEGIPAKFYFTQGTEPKPSSSTQSVAKPEPKGQEQTASKNSVASNKPIPAFTPFDTPPKPIGGSAAIYKNLNYPETARLSSIEGTVMVHTLISVNGDVIETRIARSIGFDACDDAAMTAIQSVKWEPAKQDNKPVRVWVTVPITFKLE